MSVPFTKLFSSITTSTIWREDDHTRIVWITMLAMSDKNGHVIASIPGLADLARVSLELTVKALEKLSSPDKWSSSQEWEGRRIEKIDRGWKLLNHAKFRDLVEVEERRQYMKEYMRGYRKQTVSTVSNRKQELADLAHTDADTYTNAEKIKVKSSVHFVHPTQEEAQSYFEKLGSNDFLKEGADFFDFYESKGWKVGSASMKDWKAAVRRWHRNNPNNGTMWRSPDGRIPSKHEARVAKNQSLLVNELGLGSVSRPSGEDLQDRASQRRTSDMGKVLRGRTSADG